MSWYDNIKREDTWYDEEDFERNINALLEKDFQKQNIFNPLDKLELEEKIKKILSKYPPGYRIKRDSEGWSVATPDGQVVSLHEKSLLHSLPGGKHRFDFMGISLANKK
jgi:hypothetical protein